MNLTMLRNLRFVAIFATAFVRGMHRARTQAKALARAEPRDVTPAGSKPAPRARRRKPLRAARTSSR